VNPVVQDVSIAIGILVGLLLSLEAGFRIGRFAAAGSDPGAGAQIGAVQGALLGLLGLLLGFSFAAAGARFIERQDLIVSEANAIGTAYLRADLLDEPFPRRPEGRDQGLCRASSSVDCAPAKWLQRRRCRGRRSPARPDVERGDRRRPEATRNDGQRAAAVERRHRFAFDPPVRRMKHLPTLVMGLLIASSMLSVGVIGYGCGTGGHRRASLTVPLAIVIGVALWVTFDLDRPRAGLIQLNDLPLQSLKLR
jgi:hypothetical protein